MYLRTASLKKFDSVSIIIIQLNLIKIYFCSLICKCSLSQLDHNFANVLYIIILTFYNFLLFLFTYFYLITSFAHSTENFLWPFQHYFRSICKSLLNVMPKLYSAIVFIIFLLMLTSKFGGVVEKISLQITDVRWDRYSWVGVTVRCQSLSDCWLRFNLEKAKVHSPPLFPTPPPPPPPPVEREKSFSRLVGARVSVTWDRVGIYDVQGTSKFFDSIIRNFPKRQIRNRVEVILINWHC